MKASEQLCAILVVLGSSLTMTHTLITRSIHPRPTATSLMICMYIRLWSSYNYREFKLHTISFSPQSFLQSESSFGSTPVQKQFLGTQQDGAVMSRQISQGLLQAHHIKRTRTSKLYYHKKTSIRTTILSF